MTNMKVVMTPRRLLLCVMSAGCALFGAGTMIFKEKIFATILNSVSIRYFLVMPN